MAARLNQTTEQPYQFVKQQMREKKNKTSFLSQAIEDIGSDADMERIHKWSASSMYLGGADTTVSSLMTFFLAMMLFPDVQKKAQEELDSVIGSGRLPNSSDKGTLPYIDAIVKETHRWHPVAPMAIPHSSTQDDVFNGYRIPKGSLLLPNTWYVFLTYRAHSTKWLTRPGGSPTTQPYTPIPWPSARSDTSQHRRTPLNRTRAPIPSATVVVCALAAMSPITPFSSPLRSHWLCST
jgi:hypothetical protein